MVILGFIFGSAIELITMGKSLAIRMTLPMELIKKLGDNGYKLSPDVEIDENNVISVDLYTRKENKLRAFINKVLFFIPGINILSAKINNKVLSQSALKNVKNNKVFTPMSENENYFYQFLDTNEQKLTYIFNISQIEEERQELKGLDEDGYPIIVSLDTIVFEYDPLPYRAYTKEETDKIVAATPGRHQYCNIGDRNICIIDIPENENWEIIKKSKFLAFPNDSAYDIDKISDEEAKGPFIIYPLCHPFEELANTVKCYNEICKERDIKEKALRNKPITSNIVIDNNMVLKKRF